MPFLLDTNILLYALNERVPQHERTRHWLQGTLRRERVLATSSALTGLVRIWSNRQIFKDGDAREAFDFVDALFDAGLEVVESTPRDWPIFRSLCLRHGLTGDDVPDAHLAAVAIEHDATLVSHDRGFARFEELRRLDPIATSE